MTARLLAVFAANAREAADSLCRARMRTVPGLIGILFGVSPVIAMVPRGEMADSVAPVSEAAPGITGYQRLRHAGRTAGEASLQGGRSPSPG